MITILFLNQRQLKWFLNIKMKRNKQKAGQSSHRKSNGEPTFWMFGIHAIKNALMNKKRRKLRLLVSQNAFNKLKEEIEYSGVKYDIFNTKNFKPPIAVESVHQGAFLEVMPLSWASLSEICQTNSKNPGQKLSDVQESPGHCFLVQSDLF